MWMSLNAFRSLRSLVLHRYVIFDNFFLIFKSASRHNSFHSHFESHKLNSSVYNFIIISIQRSELFSLSNSFMQVSSHTQREFESQVVNLQNKKLIFSSFYFLTKFFPKKTLRTRMSMKSKSKLQKNYFINFFHFLPLIFLELIDK